MKSNKIQSALLALLEVESLIIVNCDYDIDISEAKTSSERSFFNDYLIVFHLYKKNLSSYSAVRSRNVSKLKIKNEVLEMCNMLERYHLVEIKDDGNSYIYIPTDQEDILQLDNRTIRLSESGFATALKFLEHSDNERRFNQQKNISKAGVIVSVIAIAFTVIAAISSYKRLQIAEKQLENNEKRMQILELRSVK